MDKLLRRYSKLLHKVWLSLNMASRSLKSHSKDLGEEKSGATLRTKRGTTDLTDPRNSVSEDAENWEMVQDRILRVLTYKYYHCDLKLLHSNEQYLLQETQSSFCLDEEELESYHLQEFLDVLTIPLEVEITRAFLPVQQQPRIVTIEGHKGCTRAWRCMKDFFTFRSCRKS